MTVSDHQVIIDGNGLCTRCANINWEGLAHTIEHFPLRRPAPDQRLHVFHIDTTVKETGDALLKSPCRFCRLLGSACTIHSLVTPGQLDCVHTASSMISIEMESMVSALAITLDNVPKASRVFFREYGSITAVDFDQITSDLRACEYDHDGCTPDRLADLPGFRLIDCRTKIIVPAQSTLDIEDQGHVSTGATYQYVALSYVWGPKPDESRISQSGSLENLPRTIDDSISVCRALGYRYLWVDRYCINQKDPAEKAIQIANMGRIYSSAQLTIIASVGEDPSYGLPGLTIHGEEESFIHERIGRLTIMLRPLNSMKSITTSKWATRGWTFQEGYLSRKRLFFTDKGVHYVCNGSRTGGALHRFLSLESSRSQKMKAPSPVSAWTLRLAPFTRNLEAYSARQLSVDSDALDAITGTLNDQVAKDKPLYHLWGVPIFETDVDYDLGPSTNFAKGTIQPGTRNHTSIEFLLQWNHYRPCRRRTGFPSWSYLGWTGRIYVSPWPRQKHIGEHFVVHNLEVGNGIRDHVPTNPSSAFRTLQNYTLRPHGTRYLDVTTSTVPLCLVNVTWSDDVEHNGFHVAIALSKSKHGYISVKWSRDPDAVKADGRSLRGALFIDERKLLKKRSSTTLFVLEQYGEHFERIGLCTLSGNGVQTASVADKAASDTGVLVHKWQMEPLEMRDWQQLSTKQRILIG